MARATWHPYTPDPAFGHQPAEDEARLVQAVARLEGWFGAGAGLPVTTNVALDAAASQRSDVDPAV